jgi:predicted CxxxxCH...CXXCH cytochrome family protein
LRVAQFLRAATFAASLLSACAPHREESVPTYRDQVAALLSSRCAECHNATRAEGSWKATSYYEAIGCVADGSVATRKNDAPILRALARPSHAAVADTRAVFERWIAAGAPAFTSGTHAAAFVDPRSPDNHGRFLRARSFRPMMDGGDRDACGRCHDGAPNSAAARAAAPGATACTTCHSGEGGPLGCSTCHGSMGKAYPPRDACYFPDDKQAATHAAHVEPGAFSSGIACASCHPVPTTGAPAGAHGDGHIEVWLANGAFDANTKSCTTRCHAGPGAARPTPTWGDATKMKCGDCHGAPPPMHASGACTNCHRDSGTALHVNGKVDVGDGSGKCGACHGTGDNPWPSTSAHPKHQAPTSAVAVSCTTCHPAPEPGHPRGDGKPIVRLLGVAAAGGRAPTFDATDKSCSNTPCHYGPGAARPAPKWADPAIACGDCHSIPPPPPHSTSTSCGMIGCHVAPIAPGTTTHIDGRIQL